MTVPRFNKPLHPGLAILLMAFVLPGCGMNNEAQPATATAPTGENAPMPAGHPPLTDILVSAPRSAKPAGTAAGTAERSVTVTVRLSPELRTMAAPDQALYIFARAAQGPSMPLAIVRKQVKDLPVTVTLDDSTAMMPELRLSNFPEIVVGARIAKGGDAIAKPGDLEGYSRPTRGKTAEVVIASVVSKTPARPTGSPPHTSSGPDAFKHTASGTKSRLNIPAEVKAKWKSTELAVSGPGISARTVKLAVGGELKLESGLLLRVLAYVPAFQSDTGTVTSASNNPDNPAVLLQLVDRQQILGEGWVFQKLPDFNTFTIDRLKVQLVGASG